MFGKLSCISRLGVLEPAAFEEAIIERYPSLLSLVLNHASEATPVFWNALFCLKLLLEVLGKSSIPVIILSGHSMCLESSLSDSVNGKF